MKNNLLIAGLLFLSMNLIFFKEKENYKNNYIKANLEEAFSVTITGEVNYPKEFILYKPVQTKELIEYCLGFTDYANTKSINLNEVISENKIIEVLKTDNQNNLNIHTYNLNLVTYEELIQIKNIGEKTALNILKYRSDNNGFKNVNELLEVKLIGEATFEKIKEYFRV